MKTQKAKVVAIGVIALAGCTGLVKAASLPAVVITQSDGTFAPVNGQFYGWMFRPTEDIWVTDLGLYDVGGDGLIGTWHVCIWKYVANSSSPNGWEMVPVVSTTIGPIAGAPSGDGCHYVSVRDSAGQPILLPCVTSGTYERNYFVGFWFDGASGAPREPLGFLSGSVVLTPDAPADHAPGYPVQAYGTIPISGPWPRPVGAGSNLFGVNFKYTRNDPPVAVDDSAETQINMPVTIDVLANDTDQDGDTLSISLFTQGTNGGTVEAVEAVEGGPKLKYTPAPNVVGSDSFTYTISDGNGDTATATVSVTVKPGTIAIDIKPGSYPNSINLGANGVVPVAVLSSETFDATDLDPDTVFLEGAGVAIRGKGNRSMSHCEDVNGDGRADLVVQFDTENLVPGEFQDGMATVTVDTSIGRLYLGQDEITIVPPLP